MEEVGHPGTDNEAQKTASLRNEPTDESLHIPFNVFDHESMELHQESNVTTQEAADNPYNVVSWGRSDLGTLLIGDEDRKLDGFHLLSFQGHRNIMQIASNSYHSAAISSTGELFTCGTNEEGQVNPTKDIDGNLVRFFPKPKLFDSIGNHRVCVVSCGLYHTVCVTATGVAISFGGNEVGQLGHSLNQKFCVAPKVVDFRWRGKAGIVQNVACGDLFSLLLTTSGEVYSCGFGECTGHVTSKDIPHATQIEALTGVNVTKVACGSAHSLALTATGELYAWGNNQNGQIGNGTIDQVQLPQKIIVSSQELGIAIRGMAAGYFHSLVWSESGKLYGTGSNKYGQLGFMQPRVIEFQEIVLPYGLCISAACGSHHSLAVTQCTGECVKLFGWGSNSFGQVTGTSSATLFRQPVEIPEMLTRFNIAKIIYIAAGGDQSFAMGLTDATTSADQLLKKQFSTQASRAAFAMNASSLNELVAKVQQTSSSAGNSLSQMKEVLATTSQLFSSPSLLGGCFVDKRYPLSLDIEGLESFYKSILGLGSAAVVRLSGAILDCLNELEKGQTSVQESSVRILLILWHCPLSANVMLSADIFMKLLIQFHRLNLAAKKVFIDTAFTYPAHIFAARILKPIQEHLTSYVEVGNVMSVEANSKRTMIPIACATLDLMYHENIARKKVPKEAFFNPGLSSIPDQILLRDYMSWIEYEKKLFASGQDCKNSSNQTFFVCGYPYLLSTETKRRIVMVKSSMEQFAAQKLAAEVGMRSGMGFYIPFLILQVERSHLLQQTLTLISGCNDTELKKPLKVIFSGEEGIDEGGVRKEFFQLITTQLLSPNFGMFLPTVDHRTIWINHTCQWNQEEYGLVGVLLGLAVYNGVLLDVHFPSVFYKKLLNLPVNLDDLTSIDPILCNGLKQLLQHEPREEVEDIFCRTFEIEWEEFGVKKKVDLIPNGGNTPVTGENREEYVDLVVKWYLRDSIKTQFELLRTGFCRVVHPSSILLLQPDELELLMVGMPHLDFKELEAHTEYIGGDPNVQWNAAHPIIRAFWEIVHEMALEDKQRLLLFVTGSAKAPITGLKDLGLKIQRMCGDTMSLPTSHTCFNILMLPEYSSKDKLRDRLYRAINECEGFGLK